MTIDEIAVGGAAHVLFAGVDMTHRQLRELSGLYARRPDFFTFHASDSPPPSRIYQGYVNDGYNVNDNALGPYTASITHPSDPKLHLQLYVASLAHSREARARYIASGKNRESGSSREGEKIVFANSVFWEGHRNRLLKPASVSDVLAKYEIDGTLFRITWVIRPWYRNTLEYTALIGESDLETVTKQVTEHPSLLVRTVEHYFPKYVEFAGGLPDPVFVGQFCSPEYAREDYQNKLEIIERERIEQERRQASVPAPKPRRRFPKIFPFFRK